jgi:hypothetical protein
LAQQNQLLGTLLKVHSLYVMGAMPVASELAASEEAEEAKKKSAGGGS